MSDVDDEHDGETEPRDEVKAGNRTALSGCLLALSGIVIPLVMFSIPSIFPCHGECGIGWAGVGFAMTVTPLLAIVGIAVFIAGFRQASIGESERGKDSERSPDVDG